jgi:hypothetical protein
VVAAVAAAKRLEGRCITVTTATKAAPSIVMQGTIGPFDAITGDHVVNIDKEGNGEYGGCCFSMNLKETEGASFVFEGSEAYLNGPTKDAASGETKGEASDEPLVTNETVCRQNPRDTILRLADDVGIELTPECLLDFEKAENEGAEFKFTATDIAQRTPRVKFLNILDKAEGMALAGELDKALKGGLAKVRRTPYSKRRLVHQSVSKLRTAMGGMFPDLEVATKLAEVRREHIGFETDVEVVKDAASKSFEELNVMRWNDKADKERIELVVELARLVRSNGLLSMLEKFNLLERGLKGIERVDEEKRRIVAEIMAEPGGE